MIISIHPGFLEREVISKFSRLPSKTGKDVIELEKYAKLPRTKTYEQVMGFLEAARKSKEVRVLFVVAEWGEGKRSDWLASFTIAVLDKDSDSFVEIGKVGTGIKEKDEQGVSFNQLTNLLRPLILEEKNKEVIVKPEIVIEINYEEIQKSSTYSSGYALWHLL